jgi:hypothetical protein
METRLIGLDRSDGPTLFTIYRTLGFTRIFSWGRNLSPYKLYFAVTEPESAVDLRMLAIREYTRTQYHSPVTGQSCTVRRLRRNCPRRGIQEAVSIGFRTDIKPVDIRFLIAFALGG